MLAPLPIRSEWPRGRPLPPRREGQRIRTLRGPILGIIGEWSRDLGKCWASAQGLRLEFFLRTGYPCGTRSIRRMLNREAARGVLGKERVLPNQKMVTGKETKIGTTHTWLISQREQRQARRRAKEAARQARNRAAREKAAARASALASSEARADRAREQQARELARRVLGEGVPLAVRPVAPPTPLHEAAPHAELQARRRAEVERQLTELARAGFDVEPPPKKPPD